VDDVPRSAKRTFRTAFLDLAPGSRHRAGRSGGVSISWRSQYEKLAPRSSHDDPVAYQAFTAKTVEFLALEFQKHFPGVPILPAVGNEDAYCGDYKVQPAGPFLEMFARAWMRLPGPALEAAAFQTSFSRGGYYSALLPSPSEHRVIVLNSVFFSNQYENACGSAADTPGMARSNARYRKPLAGKGAARDAHPGGNQ
jgi:hypothetical protein